MRPQSEPIFRCWEGEGESFGLQLEPWCNSWAAASSIPSKSANMGNSWNKGLTFNISAKSSSNSTFSGCFRILRSSRIQNCHCSSILSNISCWKTGKTRATNETVDTVIPKIFDFILFPFHLYRRAKKHFQELPRPPELIKYILEENRSMRTMVWKHWYFLLHPTRHTGGLSQLPIVKMSWGKKI